MKALSLFSGIGGIDLAAEWAGIETLLFCEMGEYPQKVIRKHFPNKPIIPDVRNVTLEKLKELGIHATIDLISAGFPCQPFSHAGKRGGTEDDRYLWPEVVRVLSEVKPTWFLGENVAGLLDMEQSDSKFIMEDETTKFEEAEMVIETIRRNLEKIGYEVEIILLPACAVGSPQQRYRVFILGNAERSRLEGKSRRESRPQLKNGYFESQSRIMAYTKSDITRRLSIGERAEYAGLECGSEIVAHSQGERCEETRINRSNGPAKRIACCRKTLAHSTCGRWRSRRAEQPRQQRKLCLIRNGPSCKTMANSNSEIFEKLNSPTGSSQQRFNTRRDDSRGDGGTTKPRMGRKPNGFSNWMDGSGVNPLEAIKEFILNYKWPAGIGQEQFEWEPPRVATNIKNRAARLMGLGNSVNPVHIFPVLYAIKQIHDNTINREGE